MKSIFYMLYTISNLRKSRMRRAMRNLGQSLEFNCQEWIRIARRKSKENLSWSLFLMTVVAATFGALSEVQMMQAIYHFKAQETKNPTLQTVYDLELKWGRYGLRKTTAQASANFAQQPKHVRISHNQPCMCKFRTSPCVFGAKSPLFCRLHMRSFLLYFLM